MGGIDDGLYSQKHMSAGLGPSAAGLWMASRFLYSLHICVLLRIMVINTSSGDSLRRDQGFHQQTAHRSVRSCWLAQRYPIVMAAGQHCCSHIGLQGVFSVLHAVQESTKARQRVMMW